MRVTFPYPEFDSVDIPDNKLIGVFEARRHCACDDVSSRIAHALANPFGSPGLESLARGAESVLIISDDYTRQTPVQEIIPQLLSELQNAGINERSIRILVALGTHRPMTEAEKQSKFGSEICSRFEIINHDWQNLDNLVSVGCTSSGTDIRVNRLVVESDFVIGLGQVTPHRVAGFSGGAKIILPGVCGAEATSHTHWTGGLLPGAQVLGVWDNPVRQEMNEAAALAGLRFIVNAVCDPVGRVVDVFAGHPVDAHRIACDCARDVFGVRVPEMADIVIVDSFPKDIELWQAAKALYAGEVMVKPGGVIILVSPCAEGVSKSHPLILETGYKTESETMADVESGKLTNLMVASHCLRVGRIIKDRAKGILVSTGISSEAATRLGFIPSGSPQEAVSLALEMVGPDATISVLRHGGEALPVPMWRV